jgi:peptidoglycan/LPS O-acetylase OafA/YrhL
MTANRTPLCFFLNGGAAVQFFFILSGFVLSLPYLGGAKTPYTLYLVRRICRIYLPYLASLLLAIGLIALFGGHVLNGFSGAITNTWTERPTAGLVGQHILMIGIYPSDRYNEIYWSLIQEMRLSLVFPAIAVFVYRTRLWHSICLAASFEIATLSIAALCPSVSLVLQSFPVTLHVAALFVAGALLAKHRSALIRKAKGLKPLTAVVIAAVAFLLYSMGIKFLTGAQIQERMILPFIHHHPIPFIGTERFTAYAVVLLANWVAASCAGVAIVYALSVDWATGFLRAKWVVRLGRASYSLYLVHALVLYFLLYVLIDSTLLPYYFAFYVLATAATTVAFYNFVEVPSMVVGRFLARRMK